MLNLRLVRHNVLDFASYQSKVYTFNGKLDLQNNTVQWILAIFVTETSVILWYSIYSGLEVLFVES